MSERTPDRVTKFLAYCDTLRDKMGNARLYDRDKSILSTPRFANAPESIYSNLKYLLGINTVEEGLEQFQERYQLEMNSEEQRRFLMWSRMFKLLATSPKK